MNFGEALTKLSAIGAFQAGLSNDQKRAKLNEALERIILSGKWVGTEVIINISVNTSGELTLPRHFLTVRGVKVDGIVRPLAGQWYQFLEGTSDLTQFTYDLRDQGANYCAFADPTEPARLRVACASGEGSVRVQGNDPNGALVFNSDGSEGVTLELNGPVSTQYVTTLTSVQLPETNAIKVLYARYDDNTEIAIGIYEPGETMPVYRRYLVPQAVFNTSLVKPTSVVALVQRRFVELVNDSDRLFTDNLGALKNAVSAIHFENEGDEVRSESRLAKSLKLLNDEARRARPDSEVGALRISTIGPFAGKNLFQRR